MNHLFAFSKTLILFAGLTALIMAVSYVIGGRNALFMAFLFSVVMNMGAYWFSDKMVLASARAQPLSESQAPEIYTDVRELSTKMGIPMPTLYITPDNQPNAFATGRNPSHSAICITQGLLSTLNNNEIRGVLAHELGHVKNYDILTSTIAAVMAGAISSLGNVFFWTGMGMNSEDEEGNSNPLSAIGSILTLILAPFGAMLLQFAISRSREYEADATAAEYTGRPQDLAQALVTIETVAQQQPIHVNPAYASLYIQNPLQAKGIMELFSTHPLTEKRVARLMRITL